MGAPMSSEGMFRGVTADHFARRLVLRGWPEDAARRVAQWLCDRSAQPPQWHELATQEHPHVANEGETDA